METVASLQPGDRPEKFEHASVKVLKMRPLERFLQQGLGFRFSDRLGTTASWWHCEGRVVAAERTIPRLITDCANVALHWR